MGVGGCCSGSVHTGREKTSIFFVIKKTEVTQARELALSRKAECDSTSDSFGLARHPQPLWFLKPNGLAASRINPAPVQGSPSRPLAAPSRLAPRAFLWTRGCAVQGQASLLEFCLKAGK